MTDINGDVDGSQMSVIFGAFVLRFNHSAHSNNIVVTMSAIDDSTGLWSLIKTKLSGKICIKFSAFGIVSLLTGQTIISFPSKYYPKLKCFLERFNIAIIHEDSYLPKGHNFYEKF